jgi:O-succinylbenzoate synthase
MGSPNRLKHFCINHPIDFVISSVFETAIGRQFLIDLAMELEALVPHYTHRALGLGTQTWLPTDGLNQADWDLLWQRLA